MSEYDYDDPAPLEHAEAAMESALGSGADVNKIAELAGAYTEQGLEPEEAIAAAADWYDMTGLDETQAAAKIGQRQGWD
jgi:hypothetical protein